MLLEKQMLFKPFWKHEDCYALVKNRTAYDIELRGILGWVSQDEEEPTKLFIKVISQKENEEMERVYGMYPGAKQDELGHWAIPATEETLNHMGRLLGLAKTTLMSVDSRKGWLNQRHLISSRALAWVDGVEFISNSETRPCKVLSV